VTCSQSIFERPRPLRIQNLFQLLLLLLLLLPLPLPLPLLPLLSYFSTV
jgi:hypothetical protein